MILEKGNMWDAFGKGIFMITTNPIIRKDGAVVMGRGIAAEAKERFPQLPYDFANQIRYQPWRYVGAIGYYTDVPIWFFRVKDHWAQQAKIEIIKHSAFGVSGMCKSWYNKTKPLRIDLNFPGIGNGGLKREDVLPIIETLPDNVHVWEYA